MEWTGSALPLQEFQTAYGDGYVQCYVAVPPIPTPFSIRLRSHGYVAPGLAMYVYIDGEYQCNRFRQNLKIPNGITTRRQTEVDFCVRQKEEMLEDGTFEGKQWKFENLNIVMNSNGHTGRLAPHNGEHVGTIEVVVLRCYPGEVTSSAEPSSLGSSSQSTPEPAKQPKQPPTPKEPKFPEKATSPSSSDDSSSDSGDDSSSDSVPGAMGGMFDGADDGLHGVPSNMGFGGDMAWDDDPPPKQNSPHQWGADPSGLNQGGYIPRSQRGSAVGKKDRDSWGGSNTSRQHFNQDWGKYSSQVGRNNSPEPQATAGRNSKGNSPSFSRHTPSPKAEANPSTKYSPQVNVPVPVGQASPAIVINVNHGPLSSVLPPAAPTVNRWALSDKQGEKANEKNSSGSSGSSGSKSGSDSFKGHKKKASWAMNMPGGWGASNVESQANSTGWDDNGDNGAQANDGWTNVNDQKQDNNVSWGNNGESSAPQDDSWGPTTSGAQENNTGWNNGNGDNQNNSGSNNNEKGAQQTNDWSWRNAANEKEEPQSWGGANEKENGRDVPKKIPSGSQGKAASDESNGFPNYTMEFTQSPNNTSTSGQERPTDSNAWPSNEPTMNSAPEPAQPLGLSFQPKPYWSTWNQLPEEQKASEPEPTPPMITTNTLPGVPIEVAQRNNMSHQVHTDAPAPYIHRTSAARPMDSLDSPYAVFIFKYRSSAILEKMLNTKYVEPEAEEKRRLSTLSKDELIEHFMRAKANVRAESASSATSTVVPGSLHSNDAQTGNATFTDTLTQKLNHLNINNHGSASSNPSTHWGRGGNNTNTNNNNNNWNPLPASPAHTNPVPGLFNNGGGDPIPSPTGSWDKNNQMGGGVAPGGSPTGWGGDQATAEVNSGGGVEW